MIFKNKKNQKLISAVLLISVLLPTILFSTPNKAEAIWGVGDVPVDSATNISTSIAQTGTGATTAGASTTGAGSQVAQTGLDTKKWYEEIYKQVLMTIAKRALQEVTKGVVNWINSGFHGSPMFLENPESFFKDIAKSEIKNLVDMFGYDSLKYPFGKDFAKNTINMYKQTLENNLEYLFYFKCRDLNGYTNTANFIINFCVDDGPDTKAPIIEASNYPESWISYVSYNTTTAPIVVYTNEPATCKWDFKDTSYDNLDYNFTDCTENVGEFISGFDYGCSGTLTGLKNHQKNDFYIRCKDQPWLESDDAKKHLRNANQKSEHLVLIGTEKLVLDSLEVNGKENNSVIKDSTTPVKVTLTAKTSAGAEEGKSQCTYTLNGFSDLFTNGGEFWQSEDRYRVENYQDLYLDEGEYQIPVTCNDTAGNFDSDTIYFKVEQDLSSPVIVRAYYNEGLLNLVTDEPAECVYSLFTGCNYGFADGNSIEVTDEIYHSVEWSTEAEMYIKCKDFYLNYPAPDECTIIVKGSDF